MAEDILEYARRWPRIYSSMLGGGRRNRSPDSQSRILTEVRILALLIRIYALNYRWFHLFRRKARSYLAMIIRPVFSKQIVG